MAAILCLGAVVAASVVASSAAGAAAVTAATRAAAGSAGAAALTRAGIVDQRCEWDLLRRIGACHAFLGKRHEGEASNANQPIRCGRTPP